MKLKPQYKTLLGLRDLRPKIKSNPTYIEPKYIENIQGRVLLLDDWNKTPATWFDHSGYGNNGTVYGASTPPAATPQALGYLFDGVDDYVNVGNAASLNLRNAFTIEFWMYVNTLHAAGLYDRTVIDSTGRQWLVHTRETGTMATRVVKGGTAYDTTPDIIYSAKEWTHIASVYDDLTLKAFKNGVQIGKVDVTAPIDGVVTDAVLIGRLGIAGYYFNGAIDEVRIWNRALNATEIWSHYIKYKGKFGL